MNRRTFIATLAAAFVAPKVTLESVPTFAHRPLHGVVEFTSEMLGEPFAHFNGIPVHASNFVPRNTLYALNSRIFFDPNLLISMPRHTGVITAISDEGSDA